MPTSFTTTTENNKNKIVYPENKTKKVTQYSAARIKLSIITPRGIFFEALYIVFNRLLYVPIITWNSNKNKHTYMFFLMNSSENRDEIWPKYSNKISSTDITTKTKDIKKILLLINNRHFS